MPPEISRVAVYCGSSSGTDPAYLRDAVTVGTLLVERGIELVYGGGKVGLMGAVADAVLHAGGTVHGVITKELLQAEVGHMGITTLEVVDSMHTRKARMGELADAFLALPGGIGTFEELFEVWTWRQLGYHDKPLGLLNADGYYGPLLAFLRSSVAHGFINEWQLGLLQVGSDPAALLGLLANASRASEGAPDLTEI